MRLVTFNSFNALRITHYTSYKGMIKQDIIDPLIKLRKQSLANAMNSASRHNSTLKYDLSPLFME